MRFPLRFAVPVLVLAIGLPALSGCPTPDSLRVLPATAQVLVGETVAFSVQDAAQHGTITWSSSDASIASVDQSGVVTGVSRAAL